MFVIQLKTLSYPYREITKSLKFMVTHREVGERKKKNLVERCSNGINSL